MSKRFVGARYLGEGRTEFDIWAPDVKEIDVHLGPPRGRYVRIERRSRDRHAGVVDDCLPGTRY
jgi:1,4-alpha-glucan branching enzyme